MIPGEHPSNISSVSTHTKRAVYGHYRGRCLELSPVLPSPSDWGWKRWSSQIWEPLPGASWVQLPSRQKMWLCSKTKPIKVSFGIGISKHDNEGRVITAEFEDVYVVTAYVPNSGRGLPRLGYRQGWDKDFTEYLKTLDNKKPVILCGDLNVAHKEIDLANPKTNTKTAGFTKEERQGFTELLEEGFVDSFRHFYPKKEKQYSFWSYMGNARAKNVGWRLDYFVVSERLVPKMCDSLIRPRVTGSDHCPVVLLLSL
ncbi:DNA-(apurinic or apyrimidinic site) lyase [Desmophyllum pertusum]|uniref:DNA repair nuclease/redox regulator APEX1 n=1 Tax=Desmophyllum pertusum TaxID=174260 RepID=A0A9X0CXX6_9CNID|nr:DNA-(apurinic or apyrimidinic site) lyase [Desmophyllum pertusum]